MQTKVYVMAHRSRPNPLLETWLSMFIPNWKLGSQLGCRLDVVRNQAVTDFLENCSESHLLMIDHDIVPLISSSKILNNEHYSYGKTVGYHGKDINHASAAFLRLSRTMLEQIPKPHFLFETNEACDEIKQCECLYFQNKAKQFGFEPFEACQVGHQQGEDGIVLFPGRSIWPEMINYGINRR